MSDPVQPMERRCHVATDPNPAKGRPRGLYGNEFGRAPAEVVRRATKRIEPATTTNLIAIAAPSGGYGPYSREQIAHVLTTAWTGFRAAVHESGSGPPISFSDLVRRIAAMSFAWGESDGTDRCRAITASGSVTRAGCRGR